MIKNVKALTISSYISMFFLGVGITMIGAAARNIGLDPQRLGLLISIQQLGFAISVAFAGALADVVEKPKILFVGSLLLSIAFLTFYKTQLFGLNLIVMLFIGIGIGSYEGTTDAMLLDLHHEHQSRYININHLFVTMGSATISLYLIFLQLNWRNSSIQSGMVVLLLALFFFLAKAERKNKSTESLLVRLKEIKDKKLVAILFVAAMLAVGLELGTLGYLTTFLMELRGFSQVSSKLALVIFLAGMATGRLAIGLVGKNRYMSRYMLFLFGLSVLFFGGLFYIELGHFTWLMVFLCGTTVSALFPLIISLAGLLFKETAGAIIGFLKLAIPVGGMLVPLVISLISKESSLSVSMLVFPLTGLIGFITTLASRKYLSLIGQAEPYLTRS